MLKVNFDSFLPNIENVDWMWPARVYFVSYVIMVVNDQVPEIWEIS